MWKASPQKFLVWKNIKNSGDYGKYEKLTSCFKTTKM